MHCGTALLQPGDHREPGVVWRSVLLRAPLGASDRETFLHVATQFPVLIAPPTTCDCGDSALFLGAPMEAMTMHIRTLRRRNRVRSCGPVAVALGAVLAVSACGSSGSSTAGSQSTVGSQGTFAATATKSSIRVGTVGTFGSDLSNGTSQADANAVQAWAATVNASGGVDGHPVQVFVKDDQGIAANSLAAVKELIQTDHVVAIVGQHEAGLEQTWESYVDAEKVPVIGGSATGAEFLTDPNFYPVTNNPVNSLFSTVYGAKLSGKQSLGAVYCAEYPACKNIVTLSQMLAAKVGINFSAAEPISGSAVDYTAQCLLLKGKAVGAVYSAAAAATTTRFIANCKAQGFDPLFIDNPQNWSERDLSDSAWQGVLFSSDAPLWFGGGPGTGAYLTAMRKYEPKSVLNSSGTAGWYAAMVFQQAVEKAASSGDVTAAAVTSGLDALGPNFDLGGVIAPTTYAEGKPAFQESCGWYMLVENGQQTAPYGYTRQCAAGS